MRKLINGIVDFRERLLPQYVERFRDLAQGQAPDALFITCSDSRVVPDLLISTDPGDLFIMRNVGNLVPPSTVDGASTGDLSEASAIEYAVLALQVRSIIICGHSECGAMKAALARQPMPQTPNLAKWLHHTTSAVFRLDQEGPLDNRLSPHDQLSQLNVLVQLEHLSSYPIVRDRTAAGTLLLYGWWFDIGSGQMFTYQRETRSFVAIDRAVAERLLTQLSSSEGPH
jgi:carbonic anhydrase